MGWTSKDFGYTQAGEKVEQWSTRAGACAVQVLTLGGIIRSLVVPDRTGKPTDVVLGFDRVQDYERQQCYIGAMLGRVANRIAGGQFCLGGVQYQVDCNEANRNHLHGGAHGLSGKVWQAEPKDDMLWLHCTSPAGEGGYPGTLRASVGLCLSDNTLWLHWCASSDADTLCSLSNHSYFNLAGHDTGEVGDQLIQIRASWYTPLGADQVPDGRVLSVADTPLDLRRYRPLAHGWTQTHEQLALAKGYDHNFVPDERGGFRPIAVARSQRTGIAMKVHSTLPAVQLYSGNYLTDLPCGKGGAVYGVRHGFCLETQYSPGAMAYPHFAKPILCAGDQWEHCTAFAFSVIE